ncbi:DUF4438 domain-containing protein [Proteinivorax tanatarense]|uniref:DUF4438 domain-containing protein n=1 Tax=Proteinivorax tanatarense TaxID=1260629 RepID=A0AAU7VJ85_9FIRM
MLKTNQDKLVMQSVCGEISHPRARTYRFDTEGQAHMVPGTGGITYNVKVGDYASGWKGDHVEPGVSIQLSDALKNSGLNCMACVGNEAKVISGEAKGEKGVVTGFHGGIEHTLIHFEDEIMEKLSIGDKIQIKAFGNGLEIESYEDIKIYNLDPKLFEQLGIRKQDNGNLEVDVVTEVPARLMGSGIGSPAYRGDYDIQTADPQDYKDFGLDKLKLGDIVLLRDCDTTYSRGYLKGAVTIGIVIHSDCIIGGHGPGVTTLLTCKESKIKGKKNSEANIVNYLNLK